MKIETKFNVGDKIYVVDWHERKWIVYPLLEVSHINIRIGILKRERIKYLLVGEKCCKECKKYEDIVRVYEGKNLFKTKKEAIAECKKRNKE